MNFSHVNLEDLQLFPNERYLQLTMVQFGIVSRIFQGNRGIKRAIPNQTLGIGSGGVTKTLQIVLQMYPVYTLRNLI